MPFQVSFLIAGAMRCGTTALASFLSRHPEIGMAPQKEVHFFDAPDFDEGADPEEIAARYQGHFPRFSDRLHIGEATPIYLYLPAAIRRIARYNPRMKLIILLRDPVERALSHYQHSVVHGWERAPLPVALLMEPFRLAGQRGNLSLDSPLRRHSYIDRGFYARQLSVLDRYFPPDQVLVLSNRSLREEHALTLQRVYAFLGVSDREIVAAPESLNGMGTPAAPQWLRSLLRRIFQQDQKCLVNRAGRPL